MTIPLLLRRSLLVASLVVGLALLLETPAFAADEEEPEPTPAADPPPLPPTTTRAPAAAADVPSTIAPKPASTLQRPPRNALSVQLLSFFNNGVTLQYERQLHARISLATSLNRRWSGGESYDVTEMGVGTEGRVWLVGRAPLTKWDGPAMVGPYVGLRFDLGQTRVEDSQTDRLVGTSLRFSETLTFGARIVIAKYFELTPSYGIGFRTEVDPRGRLSSWTRFEPIRLGMTAGVMF